MTNESQSVERLVEEALALPTAQRQAYLDRACAGDREIRQLVEQLIEEQELPQDFLAGPLLEDDATSVPPLPLSPAHDVPARLHPDDVILGRFRVVRFIASGGMGEVYEVQDQLLHATPLALKIIRPHIAADPYASRSFQQEVLLARRVNHRHLCPIYDIFHCDSPAPPFLFITMKLLAGESLECRLKQPHGIAKQEAARICHQLIEGVEAMHSVGIIHRDIKPNNIILEPSPNGSCVTIMDFGLARLCEPSAALSRTSVIAGTPGYLAPELLLGARPAPASDLFALGVVLHQVLTGVRPPAFTHERAPSVAPELYQCQASPDLIHAVAELLAREPERRTTAFAQLVNPQAPVVTPARPALMTRRSLAAGAIAGLCCLGAGSVWKRREIDDYLHPLPAKRFVALLNWPPSDSKSAPMLLGLIDTMVDRLSRAEAVDHDFYVACQRSLTEMKTPDQVKNVCEALGANLILATSGSVTAEGVAISLRVLERDLARPLRLRDLHVPAGAQFSLPELVTHAAAQLLDVSAPLANGSFRNQVGTDNADALAAFQSAEALMKEPNNTGLSEAIEKYKAAVEADPHFAKAHARLSIAYCRLFWQSHDATSIMLARANAETALALNPDSVEGHAARAGVYQAVGELPGALREFTKALAPDPSNPRIITYLGQVYFSLNRWSEAEETFKRVLKARPNDWVAYNELGNTYSYQGKYSLALESYQAAIASSARNALPIANAAKMLFLLDELDQAKINIAKSIAVAPLSWAFQIRADILRAESKFAESLQAALQATSIDPEESTTWLRVADAYAAMKRHDKQAAASYSRALNTMLDQLRVDEHDAGAWMFLALYQAKTGDRKAAGESLIKAQEMNAVDIYSMICKARVQILLGLASQAKITVSECIRMGATPIQMRSTNDLQQLDANA